MSGCWQCGGEGMIVTCCDDMCRGVGHCMHGDGMAVCPNCKDDPCYGDDDEDDFQDALTAKPGAEGSNVG